MATSSLPTQPANDLDLDLVALCSLCPQAAADESGVRVRVPGERPADEDEEITGTGSVSRASAMASEPLILPPRPSWIPAPAAPPVPRDPAVTMRQEMATVPDYQPPPQAPVRSQMAQVVSPILWGAVCAVSFLMAFSVGRLVLGF